YRPGFVPVPDRREEQVRERQMPGTAAAISLARRLLGASLRRRDEPRSVVARAVAAYPGVDNGPDEPAAATDLSRRTPAPLFGLAPGGVCRARRSPACWWALTPPFHPSLSPVWWALPT